MAVIKPFRALRYDFERAGDPCGLVCPPYDIISEPERLEYINTNQYNIIRLELPRDKAGALNEYETAAALLKEWLDGGVLKRDENESLYIYEEEFSAYGRDYRIKGFISRVQLAEFSENIILPHEQTLSKAKTDRLNLSSATGCNFSQIYSLYSDEKNEIFSFIDALSQAAPQVEFTDGAVVHRLWTVTDPGAIRKISNMLEDKKLYIADGHHRYETALNLRRALIENGEDVSGSHPANFAMMTLVNMENGGLVVFPTHRLLNGIEGFSSSKIITECAEYFDIEDCEIENAQELLLKKYTEGKCAFIFYSEDCCRIFTLKHKSALDRFLPDMSESYRSLDVTVLHTLILERVLGIDKANMANQTNLTYTRDFDGAKTAVDTGKAQAAFMINPTKVAEVAAVAAAGEKMPQKSTYFYPKLITGLIMNQMKDIRDGKPTFL